MRIAILTPGYPSERAPHEYAFVHARARLYAAAGHEVGVFVPGATRSPASVIDDIRVWRAPALDLSAAIRRLTPSVLALHAPNFRTIPVARRIECRQLSWIHGHEALFSLRRVHYVRGGAAARLWKSVKLIPLNLWQLALVRRFLPTQQHVVFVSRWMRDAAERHTRRHYPNAAIIPNPVDTALFPYQFDPARRRLGIAARGLNSTKYGLDLAVRAWVGLEAADLTILGHGPLEERYRRLIHATGSRAVLDTRTVPHPRMPEVFAAYGFFLAPSRVEAQGVAMCEAMACGLPVIATRIGGIPEFVDDGVEGFLVPPEDPAAIRTAVEKLMADPARHEEMSRRARARMERQCSPAVVTEQELRLLEGR